MMKNFPVVIRETDCKECIQLIHISNTESLSQHILPHVHDLSQVVSIFIFCSKREILREIVEKLEKKIKGLFTEAAEIR